MALQAGRVGVAPDQVDTAGRIKGGGGGGESDQLWRPTVSEQGVISWAKSSSTEIPASQNIKGPKGDTGEQGPQGPAGQNGAQGPQGPAGQNGTNGVGVPTGGTTGQVLAKASATDFDTAWVNQSGGSSHGIPAGGNTGQVLIKNSNDDYDASWLNISIPTGYTKFGTITIISNERFPAIGSSVTVPYTWTPGSYPNIGWALVGGRIGDYRFNGIGCGDTDGFTAILSFYDEISLTTTSAAAAVAVHIGALDDDQTITIKRIA